MKKTSILIFFCLAVSIFHVGACAVAGTEDTEHFVQRNGSHLQLNGQPFHFNASNNDHLYHWSHPMIDDMLSDAKGLGLTAFRAWASSEGQNSWKDGFCFQPEPRVYNEPTFQQMDYIIAKAKENGIRLILPLVNNWDDGYGGMPQYVRWCVADPKDWSSKTTLTFDLYNAGDAAVCDVAIRTGSQWTWYESQLVNLIPGWNYNISYNLTASNWKKGPDWTYTHAISDLNQVQTFAIGVFEYSHPGSVYIDNIRLDSELYDGLERTDNWYATDYSYATKVELSTDYVSEGGNSLKMTYSYSFGEYNKAFAEKNPQVDKNLFYTDAACKQLYKDYISYVLNRVNTITGKTYKDDPAILMWELANEPRCESDPSGDTLQAWIDEMAGYIKSIDSNHLVSTGEEGWYDVPGAPDWRHDGRLGTDYIRNNQSPYIDIASFHLYPEGYGMSDQDALNWIQEHLDGARNTIGKPAYMGEFGITADRKATILNDFDQNAQGWSIDWNYSEGPIHVESPSRDGNGSIRYIANINESSSSSGGRIKYPEPGVDYSRYDYFTGWVYLPPSAPSDLTAEMYMHTGTDWHWTSSQNVPLTPGVWTQVKLTKSSIEGWGGDTSEARDIGIQIKRANTNYTGEVYYDLVGANMNGIYDASYQMSRRNQLYKNWFDSLNTQDADGAGFWQLFAHQDDGTLFPDYWNWGVYYPEDPETSAIIQLYSALAKNKSGGVPPPTVSLDINPISVKSGKPFTLTITGESSVALASVWWFVEDKNNTAFHDIPGTVDDVPVMLNRAQNFGAGKGVSNYTRTMTVTITNPGEYEIKANARDILYGVILGAPHQSSEGAGIPVVAVNVAPEIVYLMNINDRLIEWKGIDKEDGLKLKYSYRVDRKRWIGFITSTRITIKDLKRIFKLKRGRHLFELKSIDSKGLESQIKSVSFS